MKRFCICMLMILQLILLSACQTDDPLSDTQVSDVMTAAVSASDTELLTADTTGEGTSLSPVRYTIDYEITDIFEKHPEIAIQNPYCYTKNNQLYINQLSYRDHAFHYKLFVVDEYGTPSEYPLPPFEEQGVLPRYVYPLDSGQFVLIYSPIQESISDERYLTITDADGSFERSEYLDKSNTVEEYIQIFDEPMLYGSNRVYIFVLESDGYRHCYDSDLKETVFSILDVFHAKKYLGEDWFAFGTSVFNFSRVNLKTKEIRDYALHLPQSQEMSVIHTGSDKNYYFQNGNGIYLYQGSEQPIKILDAMDSGLIHDKNGVKKIYILNSQAIYEFNAGTGKLHLYRMTRVPDTDTRAVIQIDVMGTRDAAKEWLEDAVIQFNNHSDTYKISLNNISNVSGIVQDYYRKTIEEMLLYGSHPDMLMIGEIGILESYYEKNVFLDCSDRIDAQLLGCVRSVSGDGTKLYQIPMNMRLQTLAAPASSVPQMLTYDAFTSIAEQLQDSQFISSFLDNSFFDIYSEFIDYDAKTSHFDSEEFRSIYRSLYEINSNRTRYTDIYAGGLSFGQHLFNEGHGTAIETYTSYGSDNRYWTINGTVGTALENGDLKFLFTAFENIRAFPALKMLFGDTEFSLCGYPSRSGGSAYIHSDLSAAVLWDTEYADGCAEFLNYLLTDSMQGALASKDAGIPVTRSALSTAIDQYRYSFYDKDTANTLYNRNTPGYVSLHPMEYSAEWLPAFDQLSEEDQKRRIVEITDEDKQMLLQFFDDLRPRRQTVSMVRSIITEELSYWENNARSLEETTKIIDSRVWIYLNE